MGQVGFVINLEDGRADRVRKGLSKCVHMEELGI